MGFVSDVTDKVKEFDPFGTNAAIEDAIGVNPVDLAASSSYDPIGIGGQLQYGGSEGFVDEVKTGLGDVTGENAKKAAEEAAELQALAGSDATAQLRQAQIELRGDLAPFRQFGLDQGTSQLPNAFAQLQGAIDNPSAGVINNPFFQALAADQDQRLAASRAARGKFVSGGTDDAFARQQLLLGNQFAQQNIGNIQGQIQNQFNASAIGQNAAAQTGVSGLQTAGNIGGIMGQVANAQAAGQVGAANAQAAGTSNLIGLGAAIAPFFL
jgi:hypothetical protein